MEVEIACIFFAYDNGEVIEMLRKRGQITTTGKFNLLKEIEDEIITKLKDKQNYKKYKRPVMAFVTFTRQEAAERCLKNYATKQNFLRQVKFQKEKLEIFGIPVQCVHGTEATNLIWENLSV